MSGRQALDRFLRTDPLDVGCAETLRRLPAYAELALRHDDPAAAAPGVAAHLRACDPCTQDLEGLLAVLRRPPD